MKAFGFNGFKLETTDNNSAYHIVRPDGSNAKATLSEGEKTFVTFLYFYQLLKGSGESSGLSKEKIVVIDDPVSSLDNDVLFIISTLIKELLHELTNSKSNIKQVFVLTHNVYFFKEVTYRHGKPTDKPRRSFWIVRKTEEISSAERFESNPIKTSYDLLWSELKRKEKNCNIIQNSMRRILENYFKILGGRKIEDLVRHFDGKEKSICNSLISWTHDGSHCISDDLYVMTSESVVERYQKVFFKIFKAENHLAHYEMMMGDEYVDLDPENVGAVTAIADAPPITAPIE